MTWTAPGRDSSDSMPLGNGEMGLNVWTETNGDLLFYIARTDAWNENGRLLKLGRVRVTLDPPADFSRNFEQTLHLDQGTVEIRCGTEITLRVWVDANAPVVRVALESRVPRQMGAILEIWRDQVRTLEGEERQSAYGLHQGDKPITEFPDRVLDGGGTSVLWCHRNENSVWPASMRLQGLTETTGAVDPLLGRTFGGVMLGEGFVAGNERTLTTAAAVTAATLEIHTLTAQTESTAAWRRDLLSQVGTTGKTPTDEALAAHQSWWQLFWDRSYIHVSGTAAAETVSRGYALQRFVSACAGRGNYPIKFNGSLFTVDMPEPGFGSAAAADAPTYDADYRRWGGPYWFQNTRLTYWPLLASGDFDLMRPFFQLYLDALPVAVERTRRYFGHDGACFPETMTFWGGYPDSEYGLERDGLHISHCANPYIRYYWQGGLELCELALQYFRHTLDEAFCREVLLPLATAVLRFYDAHYGRDEDGLLTLRPAQALETWWDVVNPTPEVAGLWCVLEGLLNLPPEMVPAALAAAWRRLRDELPPVPRVGIPGEEIIPPAAEIRCEISNVENPELFAVFPYRRFAVGLPDLDVARRTFAARRFPETGGWQQNAIQAAYLGLVDVARDMVVDNFSTSHPGSRFPAFWGPNYDWVPDQDHGGVAMLALQAMLLQHDGKRPLPLPAWPREWNVSFKLHAPGGVIVRGKYQDGRLEDWRVSGPEAGDSN